MPSQDKWALSFYWVPGPVLQVGARDELDTLSALQESKGHIPSWSSLALGLAGFETPFVSPFVIISHDSNSLTNKLGRCINLCWELPQSHRPEEHSQCNQNISSLWGDTGNQIVIRMLLAKPGIILGAGSNLKIQWTWLNSAGSTLLNNHGLANRTINTSLRFPLPRTVGVGWTPKFIWDSPFTKISPD